MKAYPIHPACASLPPHKPDALAKLREEIRECGLIRPIDLLDGQVIDGRHRQMICQELGVEPSYRQVTLESCGGNPFRWVRSNATSRGPLSKTQLAWLASAEMDYYAAEAKKRMLAGKAADPKELFPEGANGQSRDKAGTAYGVSGRSVDKAVRIRREGSKQLQDAIASDRINLAVADDLMRADVSKDEREEIVATALMTDNPTKAIRERIATDDKKPPASKSKGTSPRKKQGASLVTAASRKAAMAAVKTLRTTLEQMGIQSLCESSLQQIEGTIENA